MYFTGKILCWPDIGLTEIDFNTFLIAISVKFRRQNYCVKQVGLPLALSQRCSPFSSHFWGLFEKARFFRPKQGFLVNIALFEFFTVVVDLQCMSTVYGYRTIAYIGRPLHAHVPDYNSSRQYRLYSIISMSTMMMS